MHQVILCVKGSFICVLKVCVIIVCNHDVHNICDQCVNESVLVQLMRFVHM